MENSKLEDLVQAWSEIYMGEVLEFAKPKDVSNEEVFGDVYHSLIHSSVAETLVRLEHSNAQVIEEKCQRRDAELAKLDDRQGSEMSSAVDRANMDQAEENDRECVNSLSAQHWEERQLVKMKWESDISHARDTQKREFRDWVMCVHEEMKTNKARSNPGSTSNLRSTIPRSESNFSMSAHSTAPAYQESFTITLGAQMKQMYNLRLVAADALDLCVYDLRDGGEESLPQRLQTSMSLYSTSLAGLVLLTEDARLSSSPNGITKEFAALCHRSTEYHFPTFEQQVETTKRDHLQPALAWREDYRQRQIAYEGSTEGPGSDYFNKYSSKDALRVGDFYVTRHSNLCEVHLVFHMISDDSVLSNNINSRHPVVMGLRNVLKTASLSDVTTVALPLLLTLEMGEQMTVAWCMKRAELVYKCVKGFMMEVASWGGSEIKTLQFLVPKDINSDVFQRLSAMLPGIFRTSNPIRGS